MEAPNAYYNDLLAQGYPEEQALRWTQKHYPDFQLIAAEPFESNPSKNPTTILLPVNPSSSSSPSILNFPGRTPREISDKLLLFIKSLRFCFWKRPAQGKYYMTKNGFQALEIEIIQRTGSTSVVLSSPKVHNASILAQIMLALAIFNLLIGNFQMIWGFIAVLIVGSHRPLSKLLAKQVSQALQFNENQ